MNIVVKRFGELSLAELYRILQARAAVFVVEQDCPYQDLDDKDQSALHVYGCNGNGDVLAYLRLFERAGEKKTAQVGRVITLERGKGYGKALLDLSLKLAQKTWGAETVYCEAQTYAIGFYQRSGFEVTSGEFMIDGIPHVKMLCRMKKM